MSCMMPFIFCAPCDRPIEKIRKGTRIEYGSSTKPSRRISPSSHTTPSSALATSSSVLRQQRVYARMISAAIAAAAPKNSITWLKPWMRSPASLAKPTMPMRTSGVSNFARTCSSARE